MLCEIESNNLSPNRLEWRVNLPGVESKFASDSILNVLNIFGLGFIQHLKNGVVSIIAVINMFIIYVVMGGYILLLEYIYILFLIDTFNSAGHTLQHSFSSIIF